MELDAGRVLARWMARHRRALADIIEHGTWLDRQDVDELLELAVPGIDELIGLIEIVRRASDRPGCDLVVVDTAPTGHALRLLASPQAVQSLVALLDALQRDHRIVRQQLGRVTTPDLSDRLIATLEHQAVETRELLRDRTRASFHWVMLAEELAAAETADALRALERLGVTVDEIIVNRVTPGGPRCPTCDPRRAAEAQVLAAVRRLAGDRPIRLVDAEVKEPRGAAALLRIAAGLKARTATAARTRPVPVRTFRSADATTAHPLTMATLAGTPLLFVGGKGGVGKTTVAAAIALRLARAARGGNILLLSTDPAHSLGDVLRIQASDTAGPVAGAPRTLHVRELDAAAALAAKRGGLEASLQSFADAIGSDGVGVMANRSLTELVELAPPGLDELMGILSVLEARGRYSTVVVDTAPTGHALRLLEMPAVARSWMQALLRMLLKYRKVIRPGQLAGDLVDLSRQIRTLQSVLSDRTAARFVAVTRAAALPRLETGRLLAKLRRIRVATPVVIVNAVTPATDQCPHCRAISSAECGEMKKLGRLCRDNRCAIIHAPLAVPPPRGVGALERWGRTWIV
jgi:arsenite-transporting ATPase